jgi:hypothetical protein
VAAAVAHGDGEGVTCWAAAASVVAVTVPETVAAGVGVTVVVTVALGEPATACDVAVAYDTTA